MTALATAVIAGASGVGGVSLGALLTRRNEKRATADRLLVEALNDAMGAIADVAGDAGPDAQSRYASAVSRIALHASPAVVTAFRSFQDDVTTATADGRARLLSAVHAARQELGRTDVDDQDVAVLLFGPSQSRAVDR